LSLRFINKKKRRDPYSDIISEINDAFVDAEKLMSADAQREYLRRSRHWVIMGGAWHAKRVLGGGTYSICALFKQGAGGGV
jgi:hypothetical protein